MLIKKQMIAGLLVLVLTVSGCSAVSTAPTKINELAEETRAETETESTDTVLFSESKETNASVESKAPEETESPESTEVPENSQQIAEEAPKAPETTPTPTEQPQTAQQEPQTTQPPMETPPQPTAAPEETKPKTAYDYEFDIAAIKTDCIGIGQSMGLNLDSSLTPDNAA